jgi:probable rRNA maturation factor
MMVYWGEGELQPAYKELLTRALTTGAAHEEVPGNAELSITFLPANKMKELNRSYRGKDSETDVLSFPGFPGSPALGDIVICLEVAERQAQEYGHSYERELAFLAVHGLLHLLGYNHETPGDEKEMFNVQEEIMVLIGVKR